MKYAIAFVILCASIPLTAQSGKQSASIDARKNCVSLRTGEKIADKAVKIPLALNTRYRVKLTGEAFFTEQTGAEADPMPGVVLWYASSGQDGFASHYMVMTPGGSLEFTTPNEEPQNVFIMAWVMDYWNEDNNRGSYQIEVEAVR